MWSTELRVSFRAVDGGTEVRLVHTGWEGAEDPAGYTGGVRGRLARRSWTGSCASWAGRRRA